MAGNAVEHNYGTSVYKGGRVGMIGVFALVIARGILDWAGANQVEIPVDEMVLTGLVSGAIATGAEVSRNVLKRVLWPITRAWASKKFDIEL